MPDVFVSGVELSRRLYREGVEPLLAEHFPGLAHSAALIGAGSEVLGFDTERSTDHDWGPRLQLFLGSSARAGEVGVLLRERLPAVIAGYPRSMVPDGVVVAPLRDWLGGCLGFDPLGVIGPLDWLATPTQTLAEVTGGAVHHDGLGLLEPARRALGWYPDDVWRYVLACQWQRIAQEEAFVGRCGEVGDELGSAVVAGRLARDLMRLCLLLGRVYPPYSKWLGTAFAKLDVGFDLLGALTAATWKGREAVLVVAYEAVATMQNDLGLAPGLDPGVRQYYSRPFQVLDAGRFARALRGAIADPVLRDLPLTGAVDQFVDNTDAIGDRARTRALFGR